MKVNRETMTEMPQLFLIYIILTNSFTGGRQMMKVPPELGFWRTLNWIGIEEPSKFRAEYLYL